LFFDEADALFGKRSEVQNSHDRFANIEINYLLQRIETFQGLAILATNRRSAIDTAFLRRLRFVVEFPLPQAPERQRIWERAFPPETPLENLDFAQLARLNLAGGNISNIALNAAFLARQADTAVTMAVVLKAVRMEYIKLERPMHELNLST
jgi:SpoVK/Ycf46/Vps4 family AAA+-type ATPase